MKRQYFFESYDWKRNSGLENFNFCPVCGTECVNREESLRIRPTCPNCGYVHYRNPCPGVVVIIEQEDRILLGKRAAGSFQAGKWCLPGGFIEFDEDYVASAVREVKEETNLEIEVNSILNVNSNFLSRDFHTLVITVVADVKKGCPEPGDDIVELGWFHINGDFPDMAFSADEYIIRQFRKLRPKALSFVVD